MKISFKQKIWAIVLVVVLGLVLLCTYAVATVDSSRLIQVVSNQVKANTGRELNIRGPVSIKFFPRLAVVAEQVTLSNAAWAADPEMVTVKQVAFTLEWLPLFRKQIEIQRVSLDQMQLLLQAAPTQSKSLGNWVMDAPGAINNSPDSSEGFHFDLAEVHINQVSVAYKNSAGALVDSLLIKRFDLKNAGSKTQLDGLFVWNGSPMSIKGETDSWQRFFNEPLAASPNFALDLNLGLNKQLAHLSGEIRFNAEQAPLVNLSLQSDSLDLRLLGKTTSEVAVVPRTPSGVFSADSLGLDQLPVWQGQLQVQIAALTLPDGMLLQQLKSTLTATADDAVNLAPLSFQLGKGQFVADAKLSGVHSKLPGVSVRGYATGFTLGQLMTQLGKGNELTGGPAQAAFHLSSQGQSLHALAANADGEIQISVGAATASSSFINAGGDFAMSVINAINPLRKSSDTSQLQCAVAYLPVQKGLIRINQSIGVQTDRLDVTLGGQINLGPETITLNITPTEKTGLTTGVNPAGLVQITGTLSNPHMGINKAGVVKQATGVGLAIMTGGISLLAQNAAGVVSRSSPCDNVLRPWSKVAGGLATMP